MSAAYLFLLQQDDAKIDGKTYNIGYENHSLMKIADIVKSVVGSNVDVVVEPTDDLRSYHVSSEKIRRELGLRRRTRSSRPCPDLVDAFKAGRLPNSLNDPRYFNIKMMQNISLLIGRPSEGFQPDLLILSIRRLLPNRTHIHVRS